MATKDKPKRIHRPRAIPAQHTTWTAREAAAEDAGVEYVADLAGVAPNMYWVIRQRTPGQKMRHWKIFCECKTVTKSEIEDRVAALNRGPTRAENQSWGKLTKQRARAKPGDKLAVKSADPNKRSATEWVEYLVGDPVTSAKLRAYVGAKRGTGSALNIATLKSLMVEAGGKLDGRVKGMPRAVMKQLERKFKVLRSDEGALKKYNASDF